MLLQLYLCGKQLVLLLFTLGIKPDIGGGNGTYLFIQIQGVSEELVSVVATEEGIVHSHPPVVVHQYPVGILLFSDHVHPGKSTGCLFYKRYSL